MPVKFKPVRKTGSLLRGSVGRGGKNNWMDTTLVQHLLNDHTTPPMQYLSVDGLVGPRTIGAIKHFQKQVVGLEYPDGSVEPDGPTLQCLLAPSANGTSWRGPNTTHPKNQISGSPKKALQHQKAMREEFARQGKTSEWEQFWDALVNGALPSIKLIIGAIGRAEDARSIARFYLRLREWGHSPAEVRQIFVYFVKLPDRKHAIKMIEMTSDATKPAGKMLSYANEVGSVVGFIAFLVEYVDHWRKGDYHMAFVEVYKAAMGKAIPWAGMLEGLQSMVEAVFPATPNTGKFFKVLRAVDPIGLGAVAVDTLGVFALAVFEGELSDQRLQRLVQRMKQGPARFFTEIGEDLGDALYSISRMSESEWNEALSITSMFGFAKYLVTGKVD